jgi:glycosyltransferase involved in cell wall biosynthesis
LVDLPRVARQVHADAVLVQYAMPATRRPCVVMIQDMSPFDGRGSRWLGRAHAARIRMSIATSVRHAAVMAPSQFTQREIAERFGLSPGAIPIAHCAVDPEFAALIDRLPTAKRDGPFRVLAVGNVIPRKNLSVLGRALAILRARGMSIELRIVGQAGREGEAICNDLRTSLGPAVSFSGFVTPEQLAAEYRLADVFAFPSLYEGFGIPALEAMHARVPVVVSQATSLPEVVGDAGLVVPPGNAEAWASAINQLVTDDGLRADLVARGRERAEATTWVASATAVHHALAAAGVGQ